MRLARAALRAVVLELEADEEAARGALLRLLATRLPNTDRPAARRTAATPPARRPAPAVPESAPRREGRPATHGVVPAGAPESARLVAALVNVYGGSKAAARATGLSYTLLRRWARGGACSSATVARLRAALEKDAPADDARADQPEAQALVAQLVAKHGDAATVAVRFGFGDAAMERWAAGGACSPRALERLREAAASPFGRGDPRRRQEQEDDSVSRAPPGTEGAGTRG